VWLVGMMGAGKSTVGRELARRLGRRFVDSDEEIERAAGASVAEIFAAEGEASFRRREREAVGSLRASGAVVALGGGAVAQPSLRRLLAGCGVMVYLRAAPETLLARVGDAEARPLLAGLGASERLERVRALLAEREPAYAEAALCVDTDGLAPVEVAERILAGLAGGPA
jgi:shikimate kinase